MRLCIQQSIVIHQLRVEVVSNSSILQIGTAGSVKSLSQLFNTGGYTDSIPKVVETEEPLNLEVPLVPLSVQ